MIWRLKRLFRAIRWGIFAYKYQDWDYAGLLRFMERYLGQMESGMRRRNMFVSSRRVADDIHKTRLVISRLMDDSYFNRWEFDLRVPDGKVNVSIKRPSQCPNVQPWDYENYMKAQDVEYLCMMIRKHLFEWWD